MQEVQFEVTKALLLKSNGGQLYRMSKAVVIKQLRTIARIKVLSWLREGVLKKTVGPVHLIVTPIMPKATARYDPPNYWPTVKALIDGMTDAGLWPDDNGHIIPRTSFDYSDESVGRQGVWIMRFRIEDADV